MSLIPQVKCHRCGETFSAMRSHCPNCGSRRVSQSSRTPVPTPGTVKGTAAYERSEENLKWQMIFGLILVVAVILAVIVMVSTGVESVDQAGKIKVKETAAPAIESAQPTPESAPTPPPTPTPTVDKVEIRYYTDVKEEFTMATGESLTVNALVYPLNLQEGNKITWTSANDDIIKLTPDETGTNCVVECLEFCNGGCKIFAECCGVKAECIVYTRYS